MRTISATLLAAQKTLTGTPAFSLKFGVTTPYDATAYLLEYEYREPGRTVIFLDNSSETFNTLPEKMSQGAPVELKRGMRIDGVGYTAELPRVWVEEIVYNYDSSQSTLYIECIDWWEKLRQWRAPEEQDWTGTQAATILEWILEQVGLSRAAGTMTSLSLDFVIRKGEQGTTALNRVMAKMPEYLYPGLDAEIKWKEIPGSESSVYTYGWNDQHQVIEHEGGESAWRYNKVVVDAQDGKYTGSASDATQIANVGLRQLTVPDAELNSNAECAQRAEAELDFFEAGAIETTIIARPTHGLEQFDVVTIDNPAWKGSNLVGRVIKYVEHYAPGQWKQTISTGLASQKPAGRAVISSAGQRWIREYVTEQIFIVTQEEAATTLLKDHTHAGLAGDGGLIQYPKVAYIFEDTTERNNFFTDYPNLLTEDTIIIIKENGTLALQRYTGSAWEDEPVQFPVVYVGDEAPTRPSQGYTGRLWLDTDETGCEEYAENIKTVTGTYTISGDDQTLLCDGTFTITLPSAAECTGRLYTIIAVTRGLKVTVATYGSETINDSSTQILYYGDGMRVISTGTNWRIR